jgi:hypothetical protein
VGPGKTSGAIRFALNFPRPYRTVRSGGFVDLVLSEAKDSLLQGKESDNGSYFRRLSWISGFQDKEKNIGSLRRKTEPYRTLAVVHLARRYEFVLQRGLLRKAQLKQKSPSLLL